MGSGRTRRPRPPPGDPPGPPAPGSAALPGPGGSGQTPRGDRGDPRGTLPALRPARPRGGGGLRGGKGGPRKRESSKQKVQERLRESLAIPRLLANSLALFLIELVRFLGETVVQVLLVGLLTAVGDHILKPFLASTFDNLLQPLLLFLLKVLCGIRDLMDPLLEILAGLCAQLAVLLRAVRLVEINLDRQTEPRG